MSPQAQTRPPRVSARLLSVPDEMAAMGRARLAMRRGTAESCWLPWPSSPAWLLPHAKARPAWIGGWFRVGIGMDCADAPAGS